VTLLAHRYALNPTPSQERALRSHAGAARVAFNWGLARVKANLDQREAERTYGVRDEDLTPCLSWSLYSLRTDWNAAKNTVAPWRAECSKEAFNTGLDQLARALTNWADSRKGKRKGRPVGFPRFRSKRKTRPSIRFTTGAIRCETGHAVLPRLGRIRLHEHADLRDARVLGASARVERGRWFVAFTVDTEVTRPAPTRPDVAVGVDLGVTTLAVVATADSESFEVPNPRHLATALRKVRRLSRTCSRRQGPDRRTGQAPSNRWRRADKARNRVPGRVADQRRDGHHAPDHPRHRHPHRPLPRPGQDHPRTRDRRHRDQPDPPRRLLDRQTTRPNTIKPPGQTRLHTSRGGLTPTNRINQQGPGTRQTCDPAAATHAKSNS
jgi:transposase